MEVGTAGGSPPLNRAGRLTSSLRVIDPHVIDLLVALVLTAVALASALHRTGEQNEFRGTDIPGVVLVLLQTVPLAVRRFAPLGVLTVIAAAVAVHSAAGYEVVQAGTFCSLVAVYGVTSLTDERRSYLGAAITAAALAVFFATNRGDFGAVDLASTSATWAMAWFLGTYVRTRGEAGQSRGRARRMARTRPGDSGRRGCG